jgi:hypothetical protein
MRVGFILECGPEGAEAKVIPHLAGKIDASIQVEEPVTLDSKKKLRKECGRWAKALLNRKCDRVLILWDLLPDWGEAGGRGCRHEDKEQISESIRNAGIDPNDSRIQLICIEKMLEAWIVADNRAVKAFLETSAHPMRIPACRRPDTVRDPEAILNRHFRQTRFRKYVDREHAIGIVRRLTDLSRLRRSPSFQRFEEKLGE